MSVAKVTDIIASSTKSFDEPILIGIARAHKTLKNLKSAWVQNQQIKLDNEGINHGSAGDSNTCHPHFNHLPQVA